MSFMQVNTIEAPLLAEIDSRFKEIYLRLSQVGDNVTQLTVDISDFVSRNVLAVSSDITTCINNY